jgi:DNA mismatch repair protein MutH
MDLEILFEYSPNKKDKENIDIDWKELLDKIVNKD